MLVAYRSLGAWWLRHWSWCSSTPASCALGSLRHDRRDRDARHGVQLGRLVMAVTRRWPPRWSTQGWRGSRRGLGVAMSRPAQGCQNRRMETTEFIEVLRREGLLLADAAGQAKLTAKVPPCPGWQVRDLVRHQGVVHRWAARFVTEGRTDAARMEEDGPEDGVLLSWFREGHAHLVAGLAAAPPDLDCWYFLPAPSPLAFWARRQAHETTVHRVDAEAALGKDLTPIGTAFATDGVDELLTGFHVGAKSRVRSERPRSLRVRAVDAPAGQGDWLMHLSADPLRTERAGMGPADCTVRGT
ncbi:MAG: hypothetical protein QOI83_1203, partial [Streptomycetaceae bacterium]|nr:hypothetical protein [Streptomycetaceae bacterium]